MRRTTISTAAGALLFCLAVLSCEQEQDFQDKGELFTLSVGLEGYGPAEPASKTYLSGSVIRWGTTAADKVLYVFDSAGNKNVFSRTSPTSGTSAQATFEGSVSSGSSPRFILWSGKLQNYDNSVLDGSVLSGASLAVVNPQTINNTNSFDQTANISVMKYGDDCLKNVFGYIRYTIPKGTDGCAKIKSVTFSADEALSGKIEIDCSGNEPVATITDSGNTSLTVNTRFKSGLGYEAGTLYAVLPPGVYHNLKITITPFSSGATDADAPTGPAFTLNSKGDIVILRGKYTDAGELPYVNPNPGWTTSETEWPDDPDAFDYGVIETREASFSGMGSSFPQTVDKVTYGLGMEFYTDKFFLKFCEQWGSGPGSSMLPAERFISFKINRPGTLSFVPRVQNVNDRPVIAIGLLTSREGALTYQQIYSQTIALNTTQKTESSRVSFLITSQMLEGITEAAQVVVYCTEGQLLIYPIKWQVSFESSVDVESEAEAMRASVLDSENSIQPGSYSKGRLFYVSSSGNDSNSGLSASSPIRSITKLNSLSLNPGDAVLFKRGDMWRREVSDGTPMIPAKSGVTYSSYGSGQKPILNGSPYDGAVDGKWTLTARNNVYVYSYSFGAEVGGIFLNGGEESAVKRINSSSSPFDWTNLDTDLDFFQQDGRVYFYSASGNPSQRFNQMEFNVFGNIIEGTDNVIVDNLCLRHSGSHGINTWATEGMKITNCEIGLIGGAYWLGSSESDPVRYGNGIQLYGSCDYFEVTNCWIHQCYDTGLTHQLSKNQTMRCVMENVTYRGNLIENCTWSIEYFLHLYDGVDRMMRTVLIQGHICRLAGYGWGRQRIATDMPARHIRSWKIDNPAENFVIKNNIFERCTGDEMFQIYASRAEWLPLFDSNICIN